MPRLPHLAALAALVAVLAPPSAPAAQSAPLDQAVAHDLKFAAKRLKRTLAKTPVDRYPAETGPRGHWSTTGADAWTSGFFPGSLWLLYMATGNPAWRKAAKARQEDIRWQQWNTSTHDLGFMLLDSFGRGYALTGNERFRKIALTAARSLASRYSDVVHAVRSWNQGFGSSQTAFRVIVDTMMNIELLFWGADHGARPAMRAKALEHALTTAREHVRGDGSTYHLVVFDSRTGATRSKRTVQGYSASSTWMRGQAWAVYGFTVAYRETRDPRMLATAERVADYYLSHLPPDMVPYWDDAAPGKHPPRDSSAAAVAASALLELSQLEPDPARADGYLGGAKATLSSLSSPSYLSEHTPSDSIVLHGTADRRHGHYDRGLIYGDYYFLEALVRYRRLQESGAAAAAHRRERRAALWPAAGEWPR